ncbi:MAG TPA: ROK family protein, partial [Pyrinomonadaceae bacterium]|nr:ROK family protein [Pyrinomonadaceae bacterium]
MKKVVLACDLGGTNLRMAAVDADGAILHRTKRDTPKSDRADEVVRTLVESARECTDAVAATAEIIALAAAVPATVNVGKGVLMKAPNLPSLDGFRFVAAVQSELGIRTIIENDAT